MTQKSSDGKVKFVAPPINESVDRKVGEEIKKSVVGVRKFPLAKMGTFPFINISGGNPHGCHIYMRDKIEAYYYGKSF